MSALVVDDAISILKMISFILSNEGVTVSQAKDGKEAVDKMQQFIFDFVIMDIQVWHEPHDLWPHDSPTHALLSLLFRYH